MVTAGGVRGDFMATPRQLDGYMHGVENDHESLTGEWHDRWNRLLDRWEVSLGKTLLFECLLSRRRKVLA
jgi:hypothetical protein